MRTSVFRFVAATCLASLAGTIQAAIPTGTLTFLQPTGTVGATESIEVWVRLTLAADSVPLVIDSTLPNYGLDLEALGLHPSSEITNAFTNTYFTCDSTFATSCTSGPPYDFEFNVTGPSSFIFQTDYSLSPGESVDYLFGTFTPTGGTAPPGTYYFYSTGATVNYSGRTIELVPLFDDQGEPVLDDQGEQVYTEAEIDFETRSFDIAKTCPNFGVPCDSPFSRTVVAAPPIPEPETYALVGLGLLAVAVAARRRPRR